MTKVATQLATNGPKVATTLAIKDLSGNINDNVTRLRCTTARQAPSHRPAEREKNDSYFYP
jgi:hypothetical protein